jgi:hypothetical protein
MVRGRDDPLYVRLALQAHRCIPRSRRGILVVGTAAQERDILVNALWIIVGRVDGMPLVSGTAFSLAGVGIVSATHVFNPALPVDSWELVNAANPAVAMPIRAIRSTIDETDLCLIESDSSIAACLRASAVTPQASSEVVVAGYPQWRNAGDTLRLARGQVLSRTVSQEVQHLVTDCSVVDGNSGGPMLDQHGNVVGVVRYDESAVALPKGAVDISHVQELHGLTIRRKLA